jgi:hypothetical protein
LYDLLIQHESMLIIKQITHTLYIKEINSALLREIHGVTTTAITTDPSMLASQKAAALVGETYQQTFFHVIHITEKAESRGNFSRSARWRLRPPHIAYTIFE